MGLDNRRLYLYMPSLLMVCLIVFELSITDKWPVVVGLRSGETCDQSKVKTRKISRNRSTALETKRSHPPDENELHEKVVSSEIDFPNIKVPLSRNMLPNPYSFSLDGNNFTEYKESALVFIHNPKSGGTTMKKCLMKLAALTGRPPPLIVPSVDTEKIHTDFMNGVLNMEDQDTIVSGSMFSACDRFPGRKCSYFTILRNPYDRLISHYFFCKDGGGSWLSCENKTIEEFAIETGSIFFSQITITIDCQCGANCGDLSKAAWACRTDRAVYSQNMKHKEEMLRFHLQHLNSYFAVIGLTEDYQGTLRLMQRTFGLPFYDQCKGMKQNSGSYGSAGNKTDTTERKEEAKRRLLANERVREVLHPEMALYQRAKEIYEMQLKKIST